MMKLRSAKKHSLSKKFIRGIALIFLSTLLLSIVINTKFVERYYLYRQTAYVRQAGTQLEKLLEAGMAPDSAIDALEQSENVLITYSQNTENPDGLSSELREKFRQKGLGFQKYWLWDQDFNTAMEKGRTMRIYRQDKLNYGILVEYRLAGQGLFAVAAIVPNTAEVVQIINQFLAVLHGFSLLTAALLLSILIRRITVPLKQIQEFSANISRQKFEKLEIHTNDELETAAESMNQMGESIQKYQDMLAEKNRQMEQLLDNVAHDLKTPISLIRMYASGIQDGLDDGTFLETIISQNNKMSQMVEQLLSLSRLGQKSYSSEPVDLSCLLEQQIEDYRMPAADRSIDFLASIEPGAVVTGNIHLITALFSNLLSNAVKYSSGSAIRLSLQKTDGKYCFTIANEIQNDDLDLDKLWDPFYVGEASRNSDLSGTGLGLSIVKKISAQTGYPVRCEKSGDQIQFQVIFS